MRGYQRKKVGSMKPDGKILVQMPGKDLKVKLFAAEGFPGGELPEHRGKFRVQIGRSWHMEPGRKYVFLSQAEIWRLLAGEKRPGKIVPRPVLPVNTPVRFPTSRVDGLTLFSQGWTRTEPFEGPGGAWHVAVSGQEKPIPTEGMEWPGKQNPGAASGMLHGKHAETASSRPEGSTEMPKS